MSDATPSRPSADRNLLFGILALQMDFISRDALIVGMHAWVLDKAKPLGHILVEQGGLQPAKRDLLEPLVTAHLDMHGGDAEKSLAALAILAPLHQELHSLADADVQASLVHLPTPTADGSPPALESTTGYQPGPPGLRYHVLRPHAKGGLGEVFVALDQELHREVALKEIDAKQSADPHSRGRFVREAEITGGLEHPGIVPVYGLGQYSDGRPFYAMRFIQGETLKEATARYQLANDKASGGVHPRRLDGGDEPRRSPELELRASLTRFVAVCNTIAYSHSRGVIHRDIKPSNIMLGKYGETLIVDWGLAKAVGGGQQAAGSESTRSAGHWLAEPALTPHLSDIGETQAGAALGTPAYMSPEQAAGRVDLLGPASDLYSLGATLYTILASRPPIEGKEPAEILRKAQRGEWRPPRQVKSDVPAALDAICREAMALERDQRYATALELAADVEKWLGDEPVTAWPEPWNVRTRRWTRRHRALVSSATVAALVAVIGLTAGLFLLAGAEKEQAKARKTAEEKEEETRRTLYIAHMNLVQREYEANNIAHVRELLEAYASTPPGREDLRGFEWYYWNRLAHRELRSLEGHKQAVRTVAFSPDGRRIASADWNESTVRVWDADGGQENIALDAGEGLGGAHPAFSPDSQRIACGYSEGTVKVWDAGTGRELLSFKGQTGTVLNVAYSPDGRRLASGGGRDNTVRVWDAGSGQETLTLKGHMGGVSSVAFSPDGRRIVSSGSDNTIRLWETTSGQEILTLKAAGTRVAFSPDGRSLASSGTANGGVQMWETQPLSADDFQRREIVYLVRDLFDRLLLRSEVLAHLQKDAKLDDSRRRAAVEVAQTTSESPSMQSYGAWQVVRMPGRDPDAYALAFRQAEAAAQAAPGNVWYLNTLGVAHYRLGAYAKALENLEQADKLNAAPSPLGPAELDANLAFSAMAHYQLGHKEQAQATLARLREAMKQQRWEKDADGPRFLREAEELLKEKPEQKN